jgi:1-acyl-sn-glycerol-3-phosphate acyltransferase
MVHFTKIKNTFLLILVIWPAYNSAGLLFLILKKCKRIIVHGEENMPQEPCRLFIVSNHPTRWETVLILLLFLKHCFLNPWRIPWSTPKAEFAKWVYRFGMGSRIIPFGRVANREELGPIETVIEKLEDKQAVLLFPESTRTQPGAEQGMGPLKAGGLRKILTSTECTVLPIWTTVEYKGKIPWTVTFRIGQQYESKPSNYHSHHEIAPIVRALILDAKHIE